MSLPPVEPMRLTVEAMDMRRLAAFCVLLRAVASVLVCCAAEESELRAMAESATWAAWLAAERAAFFCCLAACMAVPAETAEPTMAAVAPMIAAVPILSYELRSMIYEFLVLAPLLKICSEAPPML